LTQVNKVNRVTLALYTLATKSNGRSTFRQHSGDKNHPIYKFDRVEHVQLWRQSSFDKSATKSKIDNFVHFQLCQPCRLSTTSPLCIGHKESVDRIHQDKRTFENSNRGKGILNWLWLWNWSYHTLRTTTSVCHNLKEYI